MESGHGDNFCLDAIDKSCNITLNAEHGWSSGCWKYLVCLKPSLPILPLVDSMNRETVESSQEQFHISPRKSFWKLCGSLNPVPDYLARSSEVTTHKLIPNIPNTANLQYLTFFLSNSSVPDLFDHRKPLKMRYFKRAASMNKAAKSCLEMYLPRQKIEETQQTPNEREFSSLFRIHIYCVRAVWNRQRSNRRQTVCNWQVQHQRPGYELKIGQRGIRTPNARCCITQWWEEQWVSYPFYLSWPPTVLYIAYNL